MPANAESSKRSARRKVTSRQLVIAYWLIPEEPARSLFQDVIDHLARRYNAPIFEPHMTIRVGSDRVESVKQVIGQAAHFCRRIQAKALKVQQSGEFIKTLFVEFELNRRLQRLNEMIRAAAQDSSDYDLQPHLSLLYKKMSILARRRLARSIAIPISKVVFGSIKAVRCISPTQSRADVEAWQTIAMTKLHT